MNTGTEFTLANSLSHDVGLFHTLLIFNQSELFERIAIRVLKNVFKTQQAFWIIFNAYIV